MFKNISFSEKGTQREIQEMDTSEENREAISSDIGKTVSWTSIYLQLCLFYKKTVY